jgi:hypothetical protein
MHLRISTPVVGSFLLLVLSLTGCGKSTTASGTVTFRGKPVVYGSVTFVGADKVAHSGVIAADGVYTVENLLPGTFSVEVISRDPSHGRSILHPQQPASSGGAKPGGKGAKVPGWFALPPQYESAATSGINCTLGAGKVKYDIELK